MGRTQLSVTTFVADHHLLALMLKYFHVFNLLSYRKSFFKVNMPHFRGHLLIKLVREDASSDENDRVMRNSYPEDILRQMGQGDLVGCTTFLGSHEVPADKLEARLHHMGNCDLFHDIINGDDGQSEDYSESPQGCVPHLSDHLKGRTLHTQIRGDVSSVELHAVLVDFVRDASLMEQFVAHLDQYVEKIAPTTPLEGIPQ